MNIVSCKKQPLNAQYFYNVNDIPTNIWDELACESNLYFHRKYLAALQLNNSEIKFAYIVLFNETNAPIALATIQIIDFYLDSVQDHMQSVVAWIKWVGRKLGIIPPEKKFKILTCGNIFVSGEYGMFIKANQDKNAVLKMIAKAVKDFENLSAKNTADVFMFKDFEKHSEFSGLLHDEAYNSFNVDPNMELHLNSNWNDLDDYLAALKTKFRVKARKAFKLSISLKTEELTADRVSDLFPEMTSLYKTVATNASFNLGDFNIETYKTLKQNFGDNYILKAYWLEAKLVGFISGVFNQESFDAHYVGIDYTKNKEYALYQRMLYDYISLGITRKVKTINFGRTASEIKSAVGAIPQDLTIYLRHKKTIPNHILSLLLKRIQPSEYTQRFPFKLIT